MNKLVIPFNGNTFEEVDTESTFTLEITWDELLPGISEAVRLRNDEELNGLILIEGKILVKVSRKRGRKVGKESAINLNGE